MLASKERTKEKEQLSANQVIVQEVNELDYEIELIEAPETLEDMGQVDIDLSLIHI